MARSRMEERKESGCILFVIFLALSSALSLVSGCYESEGAALLNFKSRLTDPSNRLSSWQGRNCCEWKGIMCSKSGHVIVVNLRNPQPEDLIRNANSQLFSASNTTSTVLKGTLSPSLFTLKEIRYLDLSYNNFMLSKLPAEISSLAKLSYLNLSNAVLKDTITTQLANLTSLTSLDLSCSKKITDASTIGVNLTSLKADFGSLSSFIYNGNLSSSNLYWLEALRNLRKLWLSGLDISEASRSTNWAEPMAFLSNLKSLHLSNCKITGRVPIEQFLNLTNLNILILDSNAFNSSVPNHLANLTNLSVLDISNCNLHGSLPYLPQMKELYVGENSGVTIELKEMFAVPWSNLEILNIDSTLVRGEIPYSIANMTSLVAFSAARCSIGGSLPSFVTNLSKLEILRLDDNYITGYLPPSISNLRNLRALSLTQNKIEGYFLETFCTITSLYFLSLASNQLSGSLPECITQHPNLLHLHVLLNHLTGTIPLSIFQKSNIKELSLGYNTFSVKVDQQQFQPNFQPQMLELSSCNIGGRIPDFISNLTSLEYLSLANNNLSGSIPSWLFNLPKLSVLDLSMNKLEGVIPTTIQLHSSTIFPPMLKLASNKLRGPLPSQFKNLIIIDLSANNFTGHIPAELGELADTKYISFADNNLSGEIPRSFCQEDNPLMVLDLSKNHFTGNIPPSLGNCTSLLYLNLGENKLGGLIPDKLADAKYLAFLDLNSNYFRGSFPRIIRNFQLLESLSLANNSFEGRIPQFLGDLSNLRILNLALNFFNGTIPEELMKLERLQFLSFSMNRLSGTIPERISGLRTLTFTQNQGSLLASSVPLKVAPFKLEITNKGLSYQYDSVYTYHTGIDFSSNALTGRIPDEIGLLKGLTILNLSHNALQYEIPPTIGDMSSLETLDLEDNNLNGEIPASLAMLDFLSWLNLSHNNFSGKLPSSPHFDTLSVDTSRFIGNRYLCDVPGGMNCTSKVNSGNETDNAADNDDLPVHELVGIAMMGYAVGISGFLATLYLMKENWRVRYWRAIDKIVMRILNQR